MTKRRNLIQRVCNTSDHALSNIIKEEDFFDAKEPLDASWMFAIEMRNIVWCPVYKVHILSARFMSIILNNCQAFTSSWMKRFLQQSASPDNMEMSEIKNPRDMVPLPHVSSHQLAAMLKQEPQPSVFIVVRHPFDRLLATYREKLETLTGILTTPLSF